MKCEITLAKEELNELIKSRAEDEVEIDSISKIGSGISATLIPIHIDDSDLLEALTERFGIELGDMSVNSVVLLGDGGLGITMVPKKE